MPPIWKPHPKLIYDNWIIMIHAEAWDRLNDWEKKFVNDIENQIRIGWSDTGNLTKSQSDKLEQIYARYTS